MCFPKASLFENGREYGLGPVKGAIEATEKPLQPPRNIEIGLLRGLQNIVVGALLLLDLGRHAVEALRAVLRPRKRHVGNRARNAAIAIIERMNGKEPQVS